MPGQTVVHIPARHYYADPNTAYGKVMEIDGNAGVFAINMTALGIEDYTEAQMLDLVRGGYFEGLQSVENLRVESVGKNLFDGFIENNTLSPSTGLELLDPTNLRSKNYIKLSDLKDYYIKINNVSQNGKTLQIVRTFYYDSEKKFIGANIKISAGFVLTPPENSMYLKFTLRYTDISDISSTNLINPNIQLEEGTTATAYEPYQSSHLTADVPLRRVPNDVSDRVYESDGQIWLEKMLRSMCCRRGI